MVDLEAIVSRYTKRILQSLDDILPSRLNESSFRAKIDPILSDFCTDSGVSLVNNIEYTLGSGRADAVFNRFVIEYERPGVLSSRLNHQATSHATEQLRGYMKDLASQIRKQGQVARIAGVVFDGHYLIFVRYHGNDFVTETPVAATKSAVDRLLHWVAGLSSGLALTADNLNADFSIDQPRSRRVLLALYTGLRDAMNRSRQGMVEKLFSQWRLFFSEAIDYSEAFGDRKLRSLKRWVAKAGIAVKTSSEAEHFFFVLHTYFALLVKLMAWLALSRHLAIRLGAPALGELVAADPETRLRRLRDMESGGIFRAYGITNLLEGDFFAWYLYAWDEQIDGALVEILGRFDQYDPSTLAIVPEETRDLFKMLYHYLLPREIRHNLGEYYTPDWLAEHLLRQIDIDFFATAPQSAEAPLRAKLLGTRWLDPACGSGTFLVLIISRYRQLGDALLVRENDLLNAILNNVIGFDLNPLAVLTARVNYLLAVADLLQSRKGDITIPVYLADSVRTPAAGEDLFSGGAYEFPTAIGRFLVPAALCTKERFDRLSDALEESLNAGIDSGAFMEQIESSMRPDADTWDDQARTLLRTLYSELENYHRQGMNGLWARLLKNNFAPLIVGQFDYIVGNPPWINWEHLPDDYRQSIVPLWSRYGLFAQRGMRAAFTKDDISILMTYTVADALLKSGGKMGFVITQSVFKSELGGKGFRRFSISRSGAPDTPLKVLHVDDMVVLKPFEGAANRTAVMVLQKGQPTKYPVPYTVWHKVEATRFTYESTLAEVEAATKQIRLSAEPVDSSDATSPWISVRPNALKALRGMIGASDYTARAGTYTGGANGVYWVEKVSERPDGLVVVHNMREGTRVEVDEVTRPVEPDLLYPLLRGRDVRRWGAQPSALILLPHLPGMRQNAMPEAEMRRAYPKTYQYLKLFETVLVRRGGWEVRQAMRAGRPFYTMSEIGDYTFSQWKVVWREQAASMTAAVVGQRGGRPIIPDHKLMLVACGSAAEAYYVCALLNSSPAIATVLGYGVEIQMGPNVLEHIRIPRFDSADPVHRSLADLSRETHQIARRQGAEGSLLTEDEIDRQAARLWGLNNEALEEIRNTRRDLLGDIT